MTIDIDEVKEFIKNSSDKTKFYIGCDSQRIRRKRKGKKIARYMTCIVAHIEGKHGGRVWSEVSYHEITDGNLSKPFNRLFKEAEKVTALYELLYEELMEKDVELHLDVNPEKEAGSNIVYNAARGYVQGMTGIEPKTKPEAWAASCVSDHFVKA